MQHSDCGGGCRKTKAGRGQDSGFLFGCLFFFSQLREVSLHSLNYPHIHNSPALAFPVLGLQVYNTWPVLRNSFFLSEKHIFFKPVVNFLEDCIRLAR